MLDVDLGNLRVQNNDALCSALLTQGAYDRGHIGEELFQPCLLHMECFSWTHQRFWAGGVVPLLIRPAPTSTNTCLNHGQWQYKKALYKAKELS